MKKLREFAKTLAIWLLIAAALLQSFSIWDTAVAGGKGLYARFFGEDIPFYEGHPAYEQLSHALDVLTPLGAAVRSESGLYAATDRASAGAVFDRAAVLIAECLETLSSPSLVTSAQLTRSLNSTMLLLDFGGIVDMGMLTSLLSPGDANIPSGQLRWLLLSEENGRVQLSYKGSGRSVYRADTGVDSTLLETICAQYSPNGAFFAYEKNVGDARDILLIEPGRSFPVVNVNLIRSELTDNEYDRMAAAVLTGLGFNAYTTGSYTESDGTQVYMEEERVLRLSTDGSASYRMAAASTVASWYEPDAAARAARIGETSRLAASVLTPWLGDAGIYLTETSYDAQSGSFTVKLGLCIDGEAVSLPSGFILRAVFRGNTLTEVDFLMNSYRISEETVTLMPAVQALAAADGAGGFGIYYESNEAGQLIPGWKIRES